MVVCMCGIIVDGISGCINGNTDGDVDDILVMILRCRDWYFNTDGDRDTHN